MGFFYNFLDNTSRQFFVKDLIDSFIAISVVLVELLRWLMDWSTFQLMGWIKIKITYFLLMEWNGTWNFFISFNVGTPHKQIFTSRILHFSSPWLKEILLNKKDWEKYWLQDFFRWKRRWTNVGLIDLSKECLQHKKN